ncbi:MAG: HGGxSTG domain-containing protein [Smithella sp.]
MKREFILRKNAAMFSLALPRKFCGARTRTGGMCRQPAMRNSRCRMHGGKSKSGKEHGRYKHGMKTKEMIEFKRQMRTVLRTAQEMIADISSQDNSETVAVP